LPHSAGVSHVSAVEVVVELLRGESGLRVDGLQQRSVLGRGTAAEIVRGERQVLPALLPGARTVPDRRGVERVNYAPFGGFTHFAPVFRSQNGGLSCESEASMRGRS